MNTLAQVAEAAAKRFGEVVSITRTESVEHADFFFVACKRADAPIKDRPFMTITGKFSREHNGEVSFFWGHYDLTDRQMYAAIEEKRKVA